ncbi:MAG: hypothetical protein PHI72_05765 [Atribacterota bacterium]|nr:hypothetical protein [Atribacterota bacterium]MDD4895145.1 hypothetical protein [Atribacterota bacterium]MDD5637206.1 hypothetical protein [Atribacterota bacterium]
MNGKEWINDFVERLTSIEGNFEIFVSLFLKYEHQFVFGLKDSKEWIEEYGERKAFFSAIGGRMDEGSDIIKFLQDRSSQDIGVDIDIINSPQTYLDYHHRLKKIPINLVKGEIRPQMITIIQKARYATTPNMLIFSYIGSTKNKPRSLQYSALFFARESVLVQMFKNKKTVLELKKAGATFEERIKIPDNLYLYPAGSINSLLRFLSYETF